MLENQALVAYHRLFSFGKLVRAFLTQPQRGDSSVSFRFGTYQDQQVADRSQRRNEFGEFKASIRSKCPRPYITSSLFEKLDDLAIAVTTIGGVIVLTLSALLVGDGNHSHLVEASLVVVSGAITLIGVLQAVWRPGERSRRHKNWASQFSALESELDLDPSDTRRTLREIADEMLAVSADADLIPQGLWERAKRPFSRLENKE